MARRVDLAWRSCQHVVGAARTLCNKPTLHVASSMLLLALAGFSCSASSPTATVSFTPISTGQTIEETGLPVIAVARLPEPQLTGKVSLEEALYRRRSIREFADSPLQLKDISQLLWAAQGITDSTGKRTAPSAMAIYPLMLYLVVGKVNGLGPGVYQYLPNNHELGMLIEGDVKSIVEKSYTNQNGVVDIIMAADFGLITRRIGEYGWKYAYLEGGHAAQNICLQATALDLGTVTTASFSEPTIKQILALTGDVGILYVLPVGNKK